jgi:hypothetical protein
MFYRSATARERSNQKVVYHTMIARRIAALTALAATTQLVHAGPAFAASMKDDRQMTHLAAQLLKDSDSSRLAVGTKTTAAAGLQIDNALAVEAQMKKLARADGMTMIVPVYTELDDMTVLSDATKASTTKVAPKGAPSSGTATTVRSNIIGSTYLAVDLDKAKSRLDAAKLDLIGHRLQAAKDSLAAIGSDLIERRVLTDVPLLTARQDLSLAQRALKSKDLTAASSDLRQASKSLDAYTSSGHSADARRLAADINSAIPLTAHRSASVSTKIATWWTSVRDWFSQHA